MNANAAPLARLLIHLDVAENELLLAENCTTTKLNSATIDVAFGKESLRSSERFTI